MDFTYNSFDKESVSGISLRELGAVISRGQFSKRELLDKGITFFHTNNFSTQKKILIEEERVKNDSVYKKKFDILIARVGSRCIGNFCLVEEESILISDCILKVSLPENYVIPFYKALSSEYGKNWFKAYSHGVCAKLISKEDLLNFKIPNK
jgi:type I restriction enzyme M protein